MNAINLDDGARSPGAVRGYVRLADGRGLSYTEWGDLAGRPVLEFRGLPSSRWGDAIDFSVVGRAGVRRIAVDRPGVGFSTRSRAARCWTGPRTCALWPTPWAWVPSRCWAPPVADPTPQHAVMHCRTGSLAWRSLAGWGR